MNRRASRANAADNGASPRAEAIALPDSGQGISNDPAAAPAENSRGVGLDRDLAERQPGTQPQLACSADADEQPEEREHADTSQHEMLGLPVERSYSSLDDESRAGRAGDAAEERRFDNGRVRSHKQAISRSGQIAGAVESSHACSDEGSALGRLSPATVALFEPGARAGGYHGEPDWLDRAVVGTAALLGQIVAGTLTRAAVDEMAGDAPDPQLAPMYARLRALAADREPALLDGDSAIGHLNNALQVLSLTLETWPTYRESREHLLDVRRRIELAVTLLRQEA